MRSFCGKWRAKTETSNGKSPVGGRQRLKADGRYRHQRTGARAFPERRTGNRNELHCSPHILISHGRESVHRDAKRVGGACSGADTAHPSPVRRSSVWRLVCLFWRLVCRRLSTTRWYPGWRLALGCRLGQISHRELIVNSELGGDWGELVPASVGHSAESSGMSSKRYCSFPNTHWSPVRGAGVTDREARRTGLTTLLERYQPALLSYLLVVRGVPRQVAEDLLQAFLTDKWLHENFLRRTDQHRGRFRNFVLTSLNHFVTSWQRAAKTRAAVSLEQSTRTNKPIDAYAQCHRGSQLGTCPGLEGGVGDAPAML